MRTADAIHSWWDSVAAIPMMGAAILSAQALEVIKSKTLAALLMGCGTLVLMKILGSPDSVLLALGTGVGTAIPAAVAGRAWVERHNGTPKGPTP